jgi:hypothetical protein
MERGATERDALLRREIAVMTPDRFEDLVLALAQRELKEVRRLQHPDGGADVLRPATGGRQAEVWQAKRYPDDINWGECENSLKSAITRWKPSKVTFVFPRDLSQQLEGSFETRLIHHEDAQREGVEVTLWNLSEIVRRLDEHPDIKVRFFGREQDTLMASLDRAIKAGGQLESGADLVERAKTLSEYAQQQDVDFEYDIGVGPAGGREPHWEDLPYLTVTVGDARTEVRVTTWARDGSNVPLPSMFFVDTEEGQEARLEAVRALARGEQATVTRGVQLTVHAPPQLLRDLAPDPNMLSSGTAQLNAGEPLPLELEIETGEGRLRRKLEMRPVPPRPGATLAFAGYTGSVLVEVNFTLLEEPSISANITFSAHLGDGARQDAEAAELLWAFHSHKHVALRSNTLFPSSGELAGEFDDLRQNTDLERMEWMRRFYADLAFLEEQLGIELPQPQQMTADDINAVGTAAQVLRTGEGTGTFGQASGMVDNPLEIPRIPDDLMRRSPWRHRVSYPIFGREVELGIGEYELPGLKIVEVIPWGQLPTSPARVVLEAEGDGQMRFRLVDWQPPANDA